MNEHKKYKWEDIQQQLDEYENNKIYPGCAIGILLSIVTILLLISIVSQNMVVSILAFSLLVLGTIAVAIFSSKQGVKCPNCSARISYQTDDSSKIMILKNMHQCPECQYKFDDK